MGQVGVEFLLVAAFADVVGAVEEMSGSFTRGYGVRVFDFARWDGFIVAITTRSSW